MNNNEKIVREIPLQAIWNENGYVTNNKISYPTLPEIKQLLKSDKIQFVVANVGDRLQWIPKSDTYTFWKNKVQINLIENPEHIILDLLPNEFGYLASHWKTDGGLDIILLEMYH